MSRSPALHALLFLILGILLGHHIGNEKYFEVSIVFSGLSIASFIYCRPGLGKPLKTVFAHSCIFSCGVMLCLSDRPQDPEMFTLDNGEQRRLQLRALSFASGLNTDEFFDAEYLTTRKLSSKTKLRVYLPQAASPIQLKIEYGAKLLCTGHIQKFAKARNPGQADFERIFKNKGLLYSMRAESCSLTERSEWTAIRWAFGLRAFIKSTLDLSQLDDRSKGISLALSIGDKSALPDATKDAFKASGLMHLLAISGLHVGFIALGLFHFLSGFFRRFKIQHHLVLRARVLLVLLILLLYVILTGWTDSVLRSSIMCSVYILSLLSRRPFNSLNALAISAIVILILRPHHLLDLGFQLSFSAVFGIIALYPTLKEKLDSFRWGSFGKVVQIFCLSGVAFLATSPILLFHFSYAPLIGIVASVFSTPLCFLSLTSLWIWILLSALSLDHSMVELALQLFLQGFTQFAAFFSRDLFVGVGMQIDHSEFWLIICLVVFALLIYLHLEKRKSLKWMTLLLIPSIVFFLNSHLKADKIYDIIFFDVGHGDAVLIRSPSGKSILIDAGDKSEYQGYSRDMGRSVLIPAFKYLGIDKIDLAFLSHRHRDHFGGFESLVEVMPIGTFISNDDGQFISDSWENLKGQLTDAGIDHLRVTQEDKISIGGINIRIVNPISNQNLHGENNKSLQLLIEIGELELLFLGDSELEAEWNLIDSKIGLFPDIIKVGHHGSKTSSSPELIRFLSKEDKSQIAIISASGSFRPPSKTKRSEWENEDFDTICTCDDGSVWIKTNGKHFYTSS